MTECPGRPNRKRPDLRGSWLVTSLALIIGCHASPLLAQEIRGRVVVNATTQAKVHPLKYITNICYSPDGSFVAVSSNDNPIVLFDAKTLTEQARLEGHIGIVYQIIIHPDGRTMITAGSDGTVRIWDLAAKRERLRLEDFQGSVHGLAISPDGSRIFTGDLNKESRGKIRCWDLATGKVVRSIPNYEFGAFSMSISPDGSTLATVSRDHSVHFWATADLAELDRLDVKEKYVARMGYGNEGRLLAMVFSDRSVRVFDTAPLRSKYEFNPNGNASPTLAISPNSSFLVTTGRNDFQLRDLNTGAPLTPPVDLGERISAAAFAPDSKSLLVGGASGTIWNYRLNYP